MSLTKRVVDQIFVTDAKKGLPVVKCEKVPHGGGYNLSIDAEKMAPFDQSGIENFMREACALAGVDYGAVSYRLKYSSKNGVVLNVRSV